MKAHLRYLTPNEMRDMLERQGGVCFMPGCTSEARTQYDKRQQNGSRMRSAGFKGWRRFDGSIVNR